MEISEQRRAFGYGSTVLLSPIEVDVARLRFAIITRYGTAVRSVTLQLALLPVTWRGCDLGG